MKQMDDKYRDPLDLRMMGYSIQEIAEILEITPQNAKVRLHRARQMILKEMEAQDESAATFVDDEYTHYYQISFDGIDAVLGSTIDGSNVLVWQNDGLTYQVSSSCDLSEIISVAEGIKLDSSSNG